jgi:hypothetical protein
MRAPASRTSTSAALERVLGAELLEQLAQRGLVPLGELGGPVVGDGVGGRLEVGSVEPDDGDLGQAERLRGLQAGVARDDLAGALSDDGLPESEAADRGRDVRHGGVVLPGVRGRAVQAVERDRFDDEGVHRDSKRGRSAGLGVVRASARLGGGGRRHSTDVEGSVNAAAARPQCARRARSPIPT